jgi:hypothetical protein
MKEMKIDYELLKKQRDHLLGHVWEDNKPPQPVNEELVWGVIHMMDDLLDQNEKEKNEVFC